MYRLYINNIDETEHLVTNSVKITEQLNNRSNTCSFGMLLNEPEQSSIIELWEYMGLTEEALSGQAVLKVDNTYKWYENFRPGDEITLDFKGPNEQFATILSIDHDLKEVTLDTNLTVTLANKAFCGRVSFAGSVANNPDKQLGYLEEFEYKVSCVDYTITFNRQVVVETFQNQYSREIIGLISLEFCATDAEKVLDGFESAWTESGVALPMQDNSDDRILGNNSQETGTTGVGVATWTKTLGIPVDITGMTDMRIWNKLFENQGNSVDSLKYRIGNDNANYFEWSSDWVGVDNENCWNYDNYKLNRAVEVGSVDITQIDFLEIEVVANQAIPQTGILFDGMESTLGGFTLKNVTRGVAPFEDFRKQYERPSTVVDNMSKLQGYFWFIDYDRDIHMFDAQNQLAPFGLDNTNFNWGDMSLSADIKMLRNRQTVRGGEAPAQTEHIQDSRNDGLVESWILDYKPHLIRVFVASQDQAITGATWVATIATITVAGHGYLIGDEIAITDVEPNGFVGSYIILATTASTFDVEIGVDPGTYTGSGGFVGIFIQKSIGIENFVDPLLFDYIFNFNEKIVKRASAEILPDGSVFRRVYFPYQAIRSRVKDQASIDNMKLIAGGDGIFDGPIIEDGSILSFQEARKRAQAELDAYSNPVIKIKFKTNKAGLHAGQVIHIADLNRGIDEDYLIQKITRKSKDGAKGTYTVNCASTMFGLIEFFQLLLKRTRKFTADVSELVDIIVNQDEVITITDMVQATKLPNAFQAGLLYRKNWDFLASSGIQTLPGQGDLTKSTWLLEYSGGQTGELNFDAPTGHNNNQAMQLTTNTDTGIMKAFEYIFGDMISTQQYTMSFWVEILSPVVLGASAEVQFIIDELDNTGATIASNVLSVPVAIQDFKHYTTTFTSNSNTVEYRVNVLTQDTQGVIQIADMRLYETNTFTVTNPAIADFSEAS